MKKIDIVIYYLTKISKGLADFETISVFPDKLLSRVPAGNSTTRVLFGTGTRETLELKVLIGVASVSARVGGCFHTNGNYC